MYIIVILALFHTIEITSSFKIKNHIHKRSIEDEDIDEFRRRSPGNRSPVTFYIESECSKVGTMSQIFKVDLSSIYIKIMRLNLILCIFVEFVKNVSFKWCQTL